MPTAIHNTLISEDVRDQIREIAKRMGCAGVAPAVELALRNFRGELLVAVYDAFPRTRRDCGEEKFRLVLNLPVDLIAEIRDCAAMAGFQTMRLVGILLTGNIDRLPALIAAARGEEITDGKRDEAA